MSHSRCDAHDIQENMAGGKGHVIIKHILEDKELNGKCKMYAEVTLEPGCSLGYHEHHNESETYYILRGEGNYDDNGRIREGYNMSHSRCDAHDIQENIPAPVNFCIHLALSVQFLIFQNVLDDNVYLSTSHVFFSLNS